MHDEQTEERSPESLRRDRAIEWALTECLEGAEEVDE